MFAYLITNINLTTDKQLLFLSNKIRITFSTALSLKPILFKYFLSQKITVGKKMEYCEFLGGIVVSTQAGAPIRSPGFEPAGRRIRNKEDLFSCCSPVHLASKE